MFPDKELICMNLICIIFLRQHVILGTEGYILLELRRTKGISNHFFHFKNTLLHGLSMSIPVRASFSLKTMNIFFHQNINLFLNEAASDVLIYMCSEYRFI